jgi:hypothetical protein
VVSARLEADDEVEGWQVVCGDCDYASPAAPSAQEAREAWNASRSGEGVDVLRIGEALGEALERLATSPEPSRR